MASIFKHHSGPIFGVPRLGTALVLLLLLLGRASIWAASDDGETHAAFPAQESLDGRTALHAEPSIEEITNRRCDTCVRELPDFLSGPGPTVEITEGNEQDAEATKFLFDPLIVTLRDGFGAPYPHAPVTFEILQTPAGKSGEIAASEDAPSFRDSKLDPLALGDGGLEVGLRWTQWTDENGAAKVLAKTGRTIGRFKVRALSALNPWSVVTFDCEAYERPTKGPNAPINLRETQNPDGSVTLTWEYVPGARAGEFSVQEQRADGSFQTIAVVGPKKRSYTIPARPE